MSRFLIPQVAAAIVGCAFSTLGALESKEALANWYNWGPGLGEAAYEEPWVQHTIAGRPRAGGGYDFSAYDGGPAVQSAIDTPEALAVGPDGTIYVSTKDGHAVRAIAPDGIIRRVAGRYEQRADYARPETVGDGGPATEALLSYPESLAVDDAGNLYILDVARIRKVTTDGIIHTIAGSGAPYAFARNYNDTVPLAEALAGFRFVGPATQARLLKSEYARFRLLQEEICVAGDGTIYYRNPILGVRKISADGIISPVIEGGYYGWDRKRHGEFQVNRALIDPTNGELRVSLTPNADPWKTAVYRFDAAGNLVKAAMSPVVHPAPSEKWGGYAVWGDYGMGPYHEGKYLPLGDLQIDRSGRYWFSSTAGPNFLHLDHDGIVRWSGPFSETHNSFNIDREYGPAVYDIISAPRLKRALPNGGWVYAATRGIPGTHTYFHGLCVLEDRAPAIKPIIEVSAHTVEIWGTLGLGIPSPGGKVAESRVTLTNVGTLVGAVSVCSDSPWLSSGDIAPGLYNTGNFAPGNTAVCPIYASTTLLSEPGDYRGRIALLTLGTNAPPTFIDVVFHLVPDDAWKDAHDGHGALATYHAGMAFETALLTRVDERIDFDWGNGAPTGTPQVSIPADRFSVRWTAEFVPRYSENYQFITTSDDGVRLWIDEQLIIDQWTNHSPTEHIGQAQVTAGRRHRLHMEFFENGGGAVARLEWASASQVREVVPRERLYSGPVDSSDGLVGWWPMDDGLGSTASDVSGNGRRAPNHGLVADATWIPGVLGNALSFDGVDDTLTIPNQPYLEIGRDGADFTVAFWMMLRAGPTGAWRSLFHKGASEYERTLALWMQPGSDRIHYRVSTTASWNEGGDSQGTLIINSWTHVACVKAGRTLRLYLDGVLDSEVALAGDTVGNSGPIYVGKDPWYPGVDTAIDQLKIYARALADEEIGALPFSRIAKGDGSRRE
ncbi:MAG: hypothetical protein H0X45_02550 [Planctomycetes bacterium]|nr:hypothetical protein [Planctomycetota bacterium]